MKPKICEKHGLLHEHDIRYSKTDGGSRCKICQREYKQTPEYKEYERQKNHEYYLKHKVFLNKRRTINKRKASKKDDEL